MPRPRAGAQPTRWLGSRAGWRCAMQPNGSAAVNGDGEAVAPLSDTETDAEILRLASLSFLSYGREREPASKKLGLPMGWLDKVVKAKQTDIVARAAGDGGV